MPTEPLIEDEIREWITCLQNDFAIRITLSPDRGGYMLSTVDGQGDRQEVRYLSPIQARSVLSLIYATHSC